MSIIDELVNVLVKNDDYSGAESLARRSLIAVMKGTPDQVRVRVRVRVRARV
jgi:hypothetical protein